MLHVGDCCLCRTIIYHEPRHTTTVNTPSATAALYRVFLLRQLYSPRAAAAAAAVAAAADGYSKITETFPRLSKWSAVNSRHHPNSVALALIGR
jgi:hypothetical protein